MAIKVHLQITIKAALMCETKRYGDSVDNTAEENTMSSP